MRHLVALACLAALIVIPPTSKPAFAQNASAAQRGPPAQLEIEGSPERRDISGRYVLKGFGLQGPIEQHDQSQKFPGSCT